MASEVSIIARMFGKAFSAAEQLALQEEKAELKADEWLYKKILALRAQDKTELAKTELNKLILTYPQSFWTIEARLLLDQRESL